MARETKHKNNKTDPPLGAPLPPNLQRYWETLQRKYYSENFAVMDFVPDSVAANYWRVGVDSTTYKSVFISKTKEWLSFFNKEKDFAGNADLKTIFQPNFQPSPALWIDLEKSLKLKGFFVPNNEITRLDKEQIEPYLLYLKLLSTDFPWVELLKKIKTQKTEIGRSDIPFPIIALWVYFELYAKFLKDTKAKKSKEFKEISKVLVRTISVVGFSQKLPSAQVWDLMQSEFQIEYFNGMTAQEQATLVENAHPEVKRFWKKYGDSLRFIIEHGYPAITRRRIGNRKMVHTGKDTAHAFFSLFKTELEWVKIQAVIDPKFKREQAPSFEKIRWKYRQDRLKDTATNLQNALGEKSILDRIKESEVNKVELVLPHFTPKKEDWVSEESQKWYDFTAEEKTNILGETNQLLSLFQQENFKEKVQKRWNSYLINLGNQLLGPFLCWEEIENQLVPQWNILSHPKAEELFGSFEKTQKAQIKEQLFLEKAIGYLYKYRKYEKTEKFVESVKPFQFAHLQEQWDKAAKAQLLSIRHKGELRLRRMREFGMLKDQEKPNKKLELWLDELLLIEKEIGPYIPFVKQAFLMALPSKTSTEFDPYRHSHDGVEFDPETTQNQHKWLRGEVMKTLRHRTGKADAEQINAFALDFSGSMRHKRMRNLFKILYLMVMGLEDRKSNDAFHFFGTNFIETVNFSNDYTNRSLLFRILKQIARIDYEGIRYGGIGGTNMSEGIIGCHDQINHFADQLKERYPKRFFLKSIFVITDGEPSLGIHVPEALHVEIERRRKVGNIAIKGIYLRSKDEPFDSFMERIFGQDQFVETDDFAEAINRLVYIMTKTYKQQRIDLKQQKIKEKYERNRNLYQ